MSGLYHFFDWLYVCILKRVRPCDKQGSPVRHRRRKVRHEVLRYYKKNPTTDASLLKALDYLKHRPDAVVIPDEFREKYEYRRIELGIDGEGTPFWEMAEGKRLFFIPDEPDRVRKAINGLLIEQDIRSPHRFVVPGFDLGEDDIIADVGCAEGLVSLQYVDKVKKVYLFESDPVWINILWKTFAPWGDKVKIVPKRVSDRDGLDGVRLDTYFKKEGVAPTFVKLDVEGEEPEVLDGMSGLLEAGRSMKIAVSTYHKQEEHAEIAQYAQKRGFRYETSEGWMLFGLYDMPHPPYFRRGMIRIWANWKDKH